MRPIPTALSRPEGARQACANGEIVVMMRAGDLVDRRALRAVVPADPHLAEATADGSVALGPAPLGLDRDGATVGEHDVDVSGQPGH